MEKPSRTRRTVRPLARSVEVLVDTRSLPDQLFGVRADATDAQLKKAYRLRCLKYHPDKNVGNPDAAAKFQEISEAYTILSDSNSRAVYDKHGKSAGMAEAGGEEAMPNPGELFGQLFGGKAFEDWIGEISLGKVTHPSLSLSLDPRRDR